MAELTAEELKQALVNAQRIRIAELEYEVRQARDRASRAHADFKCVRDQLAQLLVGHLPQQSIDYVAQAHDVVLGALVELRDQLHVAAERPTQPHAPLPDNVRPIRPHVLSVGKLGPWARRDLLTVPCRADDPFRPLI